MIIIKQKPETFLTQLYLVFLRMRYIALPPSTSYKTFFFFNSLMSFALENSFEIFQSLQNKTDGDRSNRTSILGESPKMPCPRIFRCNPTYRFLTQSNKTKPTSVYIKIDTRQLPRFQSETFIFDISSCIWNMYGGL